MKYNPHLYRYLLNTKLQHSQDRNTFYGQVKGKSQSKILTALETALRRDSHLLVLNTFNFH